MPNGFHPARLRLLACLLPLLGLGLAGCKSVKDGKSQQDKDEAMLSAAERGLDGVLVKAATPSVDMGFLLSMDYDEAKAISAQSLELPSGAKIAAESVEVVKTTRDGQPRKVRAKGKVYIETGAADGAKILCQEALVDGSEAILRGKPILQRGGSILEGLDEDTVFYLMGTRLRVIGLHRITNPTAMVASHSGTEDVGGRSLSTTRYTNVVTKLPDLGPWTAGPNPLLPPLTENAVPRDIRAEMQRAAEAEAVLQQNKARADELPDAPPAPWIKSQKTQAAKAKNDPPKDTAAAPAASTSGVAKVPPSGATGAPTPPAAEAEPKAKRKSTPVSMRR